MTIFSHGQPWQPSAANFFFFSFKTHAAIMSQHDESGDVMMVDETITNSVSHLPPGAILPASCLFLPQKRNTSRSCNFCIPHLVFCRRVSSRASCLVNPTRTHGILVHQFSVGHSFRLVGPTRARSVRLECFRLLPFFHPHIHTRVWLESTLATVGSWEKGQALAPGVLQAWISHTVGETPPGVRSLVEPAIPCLYAYCHPVSATRG